MGKGARVEHRDDMRVHGHGWESVPVIGKSMRRIMGMGKRVHRDDHGLD